MRVGVSPSMAHEELWGRVSVAGAQPTTGIAGGFAVALGSSNSKITVVRIGVGCALWSPAATQEFAGMW